MHKQINQLRADLMAQFPERKDVIDGSLAARLAAIRQAFGQQLDNNPAETDNAESGFET